MTVNPEDIIILKTRESEPFADAVFENFRRELEARYRTRGEIYGFIDMQKFSDREYCPQIMANVRKKDAYVIHCFMDDNLRYDPNGGFVKLLLINDALRRASAERVINVLPYMPYMRQDRKDRPRVPISAKVIANQIEASGASRVITADMHAGQEQGFFDIPLDNLYATPHLLECIDKKKEYTVVAVDAGAVERAKDSANRLKSPIAYIGKRRHADTGEVETIYLVGEIENRSALLPEDLVDTGGTLIETSKVLKEKGAKEIVACATHALLSPKDGKKAEDKIKETGIKVYATDTIPRSREYIEQNSDWLTVISVAPLFAKAIYRIHTGESISELFK